MFLTWKDLLTLWVPWPQIIAVLVGSGILYVRGWHRLRQRQAFQVATGWRLASFLGGLMALALAMLSAIEVLQDLLFSIHMTQHLLIMMVGAPLLMLGNPYPFLVWGLPLNARRALALVTAPQARFRRVLERVTTPWIAWMLLVGATWLWHTPAAYDAALRSELLHILEHMAYFATSLLFWWQVTGSAPRLRGRLGHGFRMGYLLAALAQNEILGVAIAFSPAPLYVYYTTVPRLWGVSVMNDQALGGALMWVPGGMMYVVGVIVLLARYLHEEEMRTRAETDGLEIVHNA